MDSKTKNYLTIKQLAEKYKFITVNGIRWAIFNSEQNGFKKCIVRLGRKIVLCEEDFLQWIEEHREVKTA